MNSSSIPYQKSLDGIRGLAILLVMLRHQQITTFGWIGVQLFFILSGYLITRILITEKEKNIPVWIKLKNFWMRRILRIFPIYYLYLAILLIVWLGFNLSDDFLKDFPFLFTYTYNFYLSKTLDFFHFPVIHLWSLSVEEQFYLFYPFVVLFLRSKHLKVAVFVLIIFSICFRFFYSEHLTNIFTASDEIVEKTHYLTFSHLDFFLSGAGIVIFRLNKLSIALQNILFFLAFLTLVAGGLILFTAMYGTPFCTLCYLKDFGFQFESMKFQWPYIVLNFFLVSLILILVVEQKGRLHYFMNKIFSLKLVVSVGKVSYGMYIIHLGISYLFSFYRSKIGFISNGYILFIFYAIIVYLLSLLLYNVYEKKFLNLKERFR